MWKRCAVGAGLLLVAGGRAAPADEATPAPAIQAATDARKPGTPRTTESPSTPPPARPEHGDLADIAKRKPDGAPDKTSPPPGAKEPWRDAASLRRDLRRDLRDVRADRKELAEARPDKRDPQEDRRARREVLREMRNRR